MPNSGACPNAYIVAQRLYEEGFETIVTPRHYLKVFGRHHFSQFHSVDQWIDDGVDDDETVEEVDLVQPRELLAVPRPVDGVVDGEDVVGTPKDQIGEKDLNCLADCSRPGPEC